MRFSVFSVTDHYPDLPRSLRQYYTQLLDQVSWAEHLGFDTYFVAEHHFHEYGVDTAPGVLLGAAAARTARIGLGVAVAVLPFHHPLALAEEYAMLDQVCGGRLRLGIGSGYLKHEFDGFGIGPWEKRARFDEALEILLQGWRGLPFTYHGLYHHVQNVRLAVTPLQQPHPPLWVAILRPEAAYHVGRQGRDLMLIPYATADSLDDLRAVVAEHRRGWHDGGHHGTPDVAVAMHAYVAEDARHARQEVEPALERYIATRLYARRRSYDEVDKARLVLIGDAEQVAGRIGELADLGTTHLLILPDFGGLDAQAVRASLQRFATTVVPTVIGRPLVHG